ncbi:unnamed protein product [Ectocarpus sp. 13 AM-2016]
MDVAGSCAMDARVRWRQLGANSPFACAPAVTQG